MSIIILGIESSCDDTSAAVIKDGVVLSNKVASQAIHEQYGGVIPELASRTHQQNIIPVVDAALKEAGVNKNDLSAIAFTQGPGLLGSLLVGTSFAKGFARALNIPLVGVNHLHAHVMAHFIQQKDQKQELPKFPFLCLLVSGGNSQIIRMDSPHNMEILGQTIDDAAGEAFDKCAKIMGLPYPGGPVIDKLAREGNAHAFRFNKPRLEGYNYSFSGLKTSFLYFLQKEMKVNNQFIEENKNDLCASLQKTIIDILLDKFMQASRDTGIKELAVAGGVSANSGLRAALVDAAAQQHCTMYIPPFAYTTDNAAMVAITGYYKFLAKDFTSFDAVPYARQ